MVGIKYLSNDFQKEILKEIQDDNTEKFSICTAYTSKSIVEKMAKDVKFKDKLKFLLIGDPLSLGFKGDREAIIKALKKGGSDRVFFSNLGLFNTTTNKWKPIIHSKIYIGYDKSERPRWAFIGSPNFSERGMGLHRESLIRVTEQKALMEIDKHIGDLRKLCVPNSSLGLSRYTIKGAQPPYHIQIIDNSNPINNLEIIVVIIEKDEVELIRKAEEVRLDCLQENTPLYNTLKDGTNRGFVFIFTTHPSFEKAKNHVVKYGVSAASVNPRKTADHEPSATSGYIRFHDGKSPADWDLNPPPSGSVQHQRSIPFEAPTVSNMFGHNKENVLDFIQQLIQTETGEELKCVLNQASEEKGTAFIPNHYSDGQKEIQILFTEFYLEYVPPCPISEKLGYKGEKDFDGDKIHSDEKYSMKSDILETFQSGAIELKKDIPMVSHISPKRLELRD